MNYELKPCGYSRGGKAVKGLPVKGLKVNGFAHLPKGRRRRGLRQ